MNFREWLKQAELPRENKEKEHIYYTETQMIKDIKIYDSFQRMERAHTLGAEKLWDMNWTEDIIHMNENVIEPYKIKIHNTDITSLNNQFNKYNIYFEEGLELSGRYNAKNDEIRMTISKNNNQDEIEAMIAHEMVHKEQNKRSTGNYFKKVEKDVQFINKLYKQKTSLIKEPGGILLHRDEIKRLDNEIIKKSVEFTHLNPFEEMAYACQAVIEYSKEYNNLNDIINLLIIQKFPLTSRFKKYLYMYWLIKDKIKGE